jgi:hypothetical protein
VLKELSNKTKVSLATGAIMVATVAQASAAGVADPLVLSTFSSISDNVVSTMLAIAPFGIAILAVFLAFKYGKKIFTRLSN